MTATETVLCRPLSLPLAIRCYNAHVTFFASATETVLCRPPPVPLETRCCKANQERLDEASTAKQQQHCLATAVAAAAQVILPEEPRGVIWQDSSISVPFAAADLA